MSIMSITFKDQLGQITIVNINHNKIELIGNKWCNGVLRGKDITWDISPCEKDLHTLYRLLNTSAFW